METVETVERRNPLFTLGTVILIVFAALGAVTALYRLIYGLGATTNLSDRFPWGLWIGADLSLVALAGCGFTFAAAAYIFNLKKYHSILRRAILMGLLCYISFILILFFEIGRPFRLWHPTVMWQHHSVLFEVAWCVMLYTAVLALEFSPAVLEKLKKPLLLKIVQTVTIPLVIAGIILSTLHQSSLGSLFLIVPNKLHPIWYTPLLPVMFLTSAVMVGLSVVMLESFISSKVFKAPLETDVISGLARAEVFILSGYFILKTVDMTVRGALPAVFTGSFEGNMFLAEIGIGVIIPILLLTVPQARMKSAGIFTASLLVVIGLILNRMNISMIGLIREARISYFPSWMEFAVTLGVIAGGLLAFKFAVRYLDIFHREEKIQPAMAEITAPEIEESIRYYKLAKPQLTEMLDFFSHNNLLQNRYMRRIPPPLSIPAESALEKLKSGRYLMDGAPPTIHRETFDNIIKDLTGLLKTRGEKTEQFEKVFSSLPDYLPHRLPELIKHATRNRKNLTREDKNLLHYALHQALTVFYRNEAGRLKGIDYHPHWTKPICPVCGSHPKIGRLCKDTGKKFLSCHLCWTEWHYPRLQCPFCGNASNETLSYFHVDDNRGYRVDVCKVCMKYLKTIDEKALGRKIVPRVEDVVTYHMDTLAFSEGYEDPLTAYVYD